MNHRLKVYLIGMMVGIGLELLAYANSSDFEIAVNPGTKAFTPQELRVKLGNQVKWINKSEEEHFLTSAGPSSKQELKGVEGLEIHQLLQPGDDFAYTFKRAAIYHYFCAIHNEMWGTVIVEE